MSSPTRPCFRESKSYSPLIPRSGASISGSSARTKRCGAWEFSHVKGLRHHRATGTGTSTAAGAGSRYRVDPSKHPDATVVSGCAKGIDEHALRGAKRARLATIGCARTYNPHVQAVCDRVICLTEVDSVDMMAAYASLDVYHPAPRALTGSMPALHARNLLIIRGTEQTPPAEQVIAFPSNKRGGGGTGQGFASPMAPRRPAGS